MSVTLKIITKGDHYLDVPLAQNQRQRTFTKEELEAALLEGESILPSTV